MADSFDCATSNLLCAENSFDEVDFNATDDFGLSPLMPHKNNVTHNQDPNFKHNRSKSKIDFPLQSEDRISEMIKRESEHLPRDNYLNRLRSGDLNLSSRREALDWILKVGHKSEYFSLSTGFLIHWLLFFLILIFPYYLFL